MVAPDDEGAPMGLYLDVPYCSQILVPNASSPLNDPTGCWYAMLGARATATPQHPV